MGKLRIKPNYRRRVLRLPDLDHCKLAVLNSLGSPASRRVYEHAIDQFIAWYCSEPRLAFNRIVVVHYRMYLESRSLAANTINQQLAAVRRLAHEAADSGLLSPELAAGISRVKGVKQLGFRSGNWLSAEESSEVLTWGVDGITTPQKGFPLKFSTSNLTQAFFAGARPNRFSGCNAERSGSAESRLNEWFNTSCFSQPDDFTFGSEPRVDSSLRQQGIVNFDFAIFKRTTFGPAERMGLEFRTEFFNLFNHPQFGAPDTFLQSATFGVVNSTINNPRLVQFTMKFAF